MPSGTPSVAQPSIHPPPATPKPPSVVFGPNKDFSFYQINHNPPQPSPTPPYHLYSPHHQQIPPFHPSPSYLPPPILVPAPNLAPVEPVILVSEPHVPLVASAVPVVTPGPPVLIHHTSHTNLDSPSGHVQPVSVNHQDTTQVWSLTHLRSVGICY